MKYALLIGLIFLLGGIALAQGTMPTPTVTPTAQPTPTWFPPSSTPTPPWIPPPGFGNGATPTGTAK